MFLLCFYAIIISALLHCATLSVSSSIHISFLAMHLRKFSFFSNPFGNSHSRPCHCHSACCFIPFKCILFCSFGMFSYYYLWMIYSLKLSAKVPNNYFHITSICLRKLLKYTPTHTNTHTLAYTHTHTIPLCDDIVLCTIYLDFSWLFLLNFFFLLLFDLALLCFTLHCSRFAAFPLKRAVAFCFVADWCVCVFCYYNSQWFCEYAFAVVASPLLMRQASALR